MRITELLENPLIQKYFGCVKCDHIKDNECPRVALRILSAMCEPIKKGEKFLAFFQDGIAESVCEHELHTNFQLHPNCLRLPDAFQEKKCMETHCWEWMCRRCGIQQETKPDPVEETVRKIWFGCSADEGVKRICELLARSARGA